MPGKGAKERRKQREFERYQAIKEAEEEYLASGGSKNCGSCYCYSGCPIDKDTLNMPCWAYGGR